MNSQAVTTIESFIKTSGKKVFCMDGYSGVGKTTIANELQQRNPKLQILHLDDFVVTANTKEKLEPQLSEDARELRLEWVDVDGKGFKSLENAITAFRTTAQDDEVLLVEGIFFAHSDVLPGIFDGYIFLDGSYEEADARRVAREKARWGDAYVPEDHPDSYARLFTLAWHQYVRLYKPKERANLVVSV